MNDTLVSRRAVLAGTVAAGALGLSGFPARAEPQWNKYSGTTIEANLIKGPRGELLQNRNENSGVDKWTSGAAYEVWMGRWSRLLAHEFLKWLSIPAQARWLDVCCGSGIVSRAIAETCSPRSVVGLAASPGPNVPPSPTCSTRWVQVPRRCAVTG